VLNHYTLTAVVGKALLFPIILIVWTYVKQGSELSVIEDVSLSVMVFILTGMALDSINSLRPRLRYLMKFMDKEKEGIFN
jgi:hypothetical protein